MRYKGVYKMNREQLTFLKENMDTMKRRDIAKTLGVAPSTMYAHIKRFGGKIRKGHEPKSELRKIVQKYYPIMTPRELVERFELECHGKHTLKDGRVITELSIFD